MLHTDRPLPRLNDGLPPPRRAGERPTTAARKSTLPAQTLQTWPAKFGALLDQVDSSHGTDTHVTLVLYVASPATGSKRRQRLNTVHVGDLRCFAGTLPLRLKSLERLMSTSLKGRKIDRALETTLRLVIRHREDDRLIRTSRPLAIDEFYSAPRWRNTAEAAQ